jgi:hypothetical protein
MLIGIAVVAMGHDYNGPALGDYARHRYAIVLILAKCTAEKPVISRDSE